MLPEYVGGSETSSLEGGTGESGSFGTKVSADSAAFSSSGLVFFRGRMVFFRTSGEGLSS